MRAEAPARAKSHTQTSAAVFPAGTAIAARVSSALPMKVESPNLKQFLEAVLRGAAKIFGCGSTNLILYNEKTQKIRVHLGITADVFPVIDEIEKDRKSVV